MWSVVSEPSSTLWFADWVDISVATVGSESLRVHVDYCWRRRADNDVTANKHCCSTATMTIKFISLGIVVDRVYHESRLPSEAPPMERSVMHLRSTHPLKNVDWCWRSSDSWPGFFLLRSRWSFWRKLTHYHCQAICMFTCMKKLLLVPDVVSTSRPTWGNFIGCQCDSASWIQADSFGVQSAKWPVSTVFGGWLPASLLPADDDCDHQTGSLIHCCWTASVEPLEQPSWLVAYSTVGGTPVGELTLSCARPSANGWPLCG